MNGLLRRVAARAAGTAVAVRSDAGLAYAGGGLAPGEVDAAQAPVGAPLEPASSAAAPPWMPSPPATPAHQRTMTSAAVDPVARFDAVRAPPALVDAPPDAAPAWGAPPTAPDARVGQGVDATRSRGFDEAPGEMPPRPAGALPMPRLFPAEIAPEPGIAPALRGIATPAHTASPADGPAPLMPCEARAPIPLAPLPQAAARRDAWPHGAAAPQGGADTEVHIHIGRIDVTAEREAPAPRRRAPAAPAPMSLDGYLAKRGRS